MRDRIEVLILITLTLGFVTGITLVQLGAMPQTVGTLAVTLGYIVSVLIFGLFMAGFDGENAGRWTFGTRFRRHGNTLCTCEK